MEKTKKSCHEKTLNTMTRMVMYKNLMAYLEEF